MHQRVLAADGHCVRMQMDVSLSLECRKPKKGIALVVDAGIAANHFVPIGDDDVSRITTCTQFLKECFVRNKTAKFQPIIIFEQLVITMDAFKLPTTSIFPFSSFFRQFVCLESLLGSLLCRVMYLLQAIGL